MLVFIGVQVVVQLLVDEFCHIEFHHPILLIVEFILQPHHHIEPGIVFSLLIIFLKLPIFPTMKKKLIKASIGF